MRRGRVLPALALALLPAAGCADDRDTTITVLAAASLTESFEDLAARFESDHPGVEVRLAFDSSATLAQQAVEGAPADVLATADETSMEQAGAALEGDPQVFASNTLVLVTPSANPAGLEGVADLGSGDVTWVACVETAPCGRVARALLTANDVTTDAASLEVDVKAVLAKVTGDEADAGIVYATDAEAAGAQVRTFRIPYSAENATRYQLALLERSGDRALAQEFVDLVLSVDGQRVLSDAGFGQP